MPAAPWYAMRTFAVAPARLWAARPAAPAPLGRHSAPRGATRWRPTKFRWGIEVNRVHLAIYTLVLVVALVLAGTAVALLSTPLDRFAYGFRPGDTWQNRVLITQDTTFVSEGQPEHNESTTRLTFRLKTLSDGPRGATLLLDDLAVAIRLSPILPFSKVPVPSNLSLDLSMTHDGIIKAKRENNVGLEMIGAPEITSILGFVQPVLPEEDIEPGTRWSELRGVPLTDNRALFTYRLLGVTRRGADRQATVGFTFATGGQKKLTVGRGHYVSRIELSGEGRAVFSTVSGRLLSSRVTYLNREYQPATGFVPETQISSNRMVVRFDRTGVSPSP